MLEEKQKTNLRNLQINRFKDACLTCSIIQLYLRRAKKMIPIYTTNFKELSQSKKKPKQTKPPNNSPFIIHGISKITIFAERTKRTGNNLNTKCCVFLCLRGGTAIMAM